ncbi:very long chain fatty acid elongase 4-like [Amphiura filiformis]|uniref:very long chain fatty acid elongase 4-like n=1 Tax=Amphiura filiformis TaxID=82378 RepID=UPI003B20CB77
MDLLTDAVNDSYNFYLHALTFSDPRVENWLFLQSPVPTLVIIFLYCLMVWLGPKLMEGREPFDLKRPMLVYNFLCMVLSFHIVKENVICGYKLGYSLSCQEVVYSYDPHEYRIAKALWWFYFSKCFEMLDTLIFILRKKNSQLTFLHVYHHASMFALWWIGMKWVAGGQSWFGATLNSFIHFVMYGYYTLSAAGPRFYKYLWWKRYLTQLQFAQFAIGLFHAAQSLYVNCNFPLWMQWALIVYGITIFSLFMNFYIHAYIRGKRLPKSQVAKADKTSNGVASTAGKENGIKSGGDYNERKKTK